MLAVLKIQNLAIIEDLELEFGPGLNVLTGETGAGKSIILKAIDLLTGRRTSADVVRNGSERCTVEGLFYISKDLLEGFIPYDSNLQEILGEEEILIRRIIDTAGRSKFYINGQLTTAGIVANLSQALIDITGQHQQRSLLDASEHRTLLDNFGVSANLLTEVNLAYSDYSTKNNRLNSFLKDHSAKLIHISQLRAEYEELASAALREGERAEIEIELKRLANSETLSSIINNALEIIDSGNGLDNYGLDNYLRQLQTLLAHAVNLDPKIESCAELLNLAAIQVSEARIYLNQYGSSLEADPQRLENLRTRLAEIARLERKYNKSEAALVKYFKSIESEIKEFESQDLDEYKLKVQVDESRNILTALEKSLTAERKVTGERLSKLVEKELRQLNMKHAKFIVSLTPTHSSAQGADSVEFLLAANPGEPPLGLAKVASGGELSRILLTLKTLLNQQRKPSTQIFDEIDTGIGGAIAQVVGERLRRISDGSQVILITHSPQIAALADQHFLIQKATSNQRTTTSVSRLSEKDRVSHIASMLAGKKTSVNFEESARELLALRQTEQINS